MRTARTIACLCALLASAAGWVRGVPFERPGWAIRGEFPQEPKHDEFHAPSPFGDVVSERYYLELAGEAFLLVRSVHPVAFAAAARERLYEQAKTDSLAARSGVVVADQPMPFGDYLGRRFVFEHRRAQRTKELRLVLIGSTLYACSYERPAKTPVSETAKPFLAALALQPAFANARAVEETERWREVGDGRFRVRYDATRWYRDPTDAEPGIFNMLRVDKLAEAQLIAETEPAHGADLVDTVLQSARESAEELVVRKRAKKLRSGVDFDDVEFVARLDGSTYVNRGYFYAGPEGTVQLRAWATEGDFRGVAGDIAEFLDGLRIIR